MLTVTLVNNPLADGVERVNREVMKLSDLSVLPWIQIQINSWVNSATGYSPFEL